MVVSYFEGGARLDDAYVGDGMRMECLLEDGSDVVRAGTDLCPAGLVWVGLGFVGGRERLAAYDG